MLWPWAERSQSVDFVLGQKLPLKDDQLPFMCKWQKFMMKDPVCADLHIPVAKLNEIAEYKVRGEEAPYDPI